MLYRILGEGTTSRHGAHWPFAIDLSDRSPNCPINFSEGAAMLAMSAAVPLQEVLLPHWQDHLRICGCTWLLALAREEQTRATPFTAAEILARVPPAPHP